jgi:geranylgeranyl pyrophosphate synthase
VEFKEVIDKKTKIVFDSMRNISYVNVDNEKIKDAIRYSLSLDDEAAVNNFFAFYRSKFLFFSAEMFDISSEMLLDCAKGIEYIHTSSLVLDDLPSMDNSALRRGKESTHSKYGQDIAILTALYLLVEGQKLIINNGAKLGDVSSINVSLAKTLKLEGLIGGQARDLTWKHKDVSDYLKTYFMKNRLIEFSILLPTLLCKPFAFNKDLEFFAKNISTAYQIHDDLRDQITSDMTGKSEKKDSKKLSNLSSNDEMIAMRDDLIKKSINRIKPIQNSKNLINFTEYIFYRRV